VSARGKARNRALDVLFEAEQRSVSAFDVLRARREKTDQVVNPYTLEIVEGVLSQQAAIDEFLETYSQGWSLERMPAVDRNTLRLGAYEILYVDDVPDAVAVSEAMALVRDLSTDESPAFVNGILGNIVRNKPALSA
jgi:transcription antitermination protein NusB